MHLCNVFCLSTVNFFVELVDFLFSFQDVKAVLSNKLCQDPVEKLFGQQRQRGRVNENPNASEFLKNTQALRVVNGVCRNIKGNRRGSNSTSKLNLSELSQPLPKRRKIDTSTSMMS